MTEKRWTFIPEPGHRLTARKTRELQLSQIRAHAARASRQARRSDQVQRPSPTRTGPRGLAPVSRSQHYDETDNHEALARSRRLESPLPPFGNYRGELYDFLPTKNHQLISLVDVYFQSLMPIDDLPFRVFDIPSIYTTGSSGMAGDLGMFFAIIAGFQQCIDHLSGLQQAGGSTSSVILSSRNIALKMLAQRLNQPLAHLDDGFIQTVALLAWQARHAGDESGYELHWRNYRQLVRARAATSFSSERFENAPSSLVVLDSTATLESGQSMFAHVRPTYSPPHPSTSINLEDSSDIASLPRGFQILARHQLLSPPTITVLARAASIYNSLQTSSQVLDPEPKRKWRYRDYIEACPCLGSTEVSLDRMICLTLIVYCFTGFSQARHLAYSFAGPREVLTRDLAERSSTAFEEWNWAPEIKKMVRVAGTNCLLWVLLVTVDSWRDGEDLNAKGQTLVDSLRATLEQQGLRVEWDDVEALMKEFFWYEGMRQWWRSRWPP